jgi:CBS domain-containing protein
VIVADIVRRSAPSVREHTVLTVAADALMESGLGSLPVLAPDGLLTGVVREGDLLRFVVGTGPLTTQTNRSRDPQWLTTPASPETPAAPPALTESR